MARRLLGKQFSGFEDLPKGRATDKLTAGCLCLEGGAMRGVYTSGVLDALMDHGLNFECVIGVSAGALNGISYVAGQIGRSARLNLGYRHDPRMFGLSPLVRDRSVYGFSFVFDDVKNIDDIEDLDEERFMNSKQRFIAAATNCETGEPIYFEKGKCQDIFQATRASASMQFLSRMVDVEGVKCLDGCASVHTPYQWALEQNFEKIIAIRTRVKEYRKEPGESLLADKVYRNYPEYAESLKHADEEYNVECNEMDLLERQGRIFVLCPSKEFDVTKLESDMEKLGEWYYLGYNDMIDALPRLYKYLGLNEFGEPDEFIVTPEGIVKKKTKRKPKNSHKYFSNKECKYYPCHEGIEEVNCMFCYCPMYHMPDCLGTPKYKIKNGKTVKVCTSCTYPHKPENYDHIMEKLRREKK